MNSGEFVVTITGRELMYLRNTEFLPEELARLINSASPSGADRYSIEVSPQDAEQLRTCFTERLARVGFDDNYAQTREGETLEVLIDRFYVR